MMASGHEKKLSTASPKDSSPATGQYDERSIEVKGVPLDFSLEAICLYFENRKRSGGGPIPLEPVRDRKTGVIQITFELAKDAANVVKRKSHISNGLEMDVGWYKPQAVHGDTVFISNVHKSTMKDTLIDFLETKTQMDVKQVLPGNEAGSFLVYVNGIIDFEKVQEICNLRPLTGNILRMSELPTTSTILLRIIPPQMNCEVIELYFENTTKSAGGDTSSVKKLSDNIYLVTFENQSDVTAVCNREHTLLGSKLEVTPYYELLESSVTSEEETFEHTEVQLQSVLQLQFLVRHKTIVEDQLKSTAQVIWAESQGDKLKLKHKKGSNEETHKKILTDLIETVTVEKLDIPESIFEEVKEEIENIKQSVFFDGESHSGVIMAFKKSEVDALKETLLSDIIKPKYKTEEIALKQYKIDLLLADDFQTRMENEYSGLKITYPNGKIAFNGYSSQIREVQLNMFQFLESVISSVLDLPLNAEKIINNPPIRCYLLEKIKEKNCVGSWEMARDGSFWLYSVDNKSISIIKDIIKTQFKILNFDNDEKIKLIIKSKIWENFLEEIEKEFKGLYYIDESTFSVVTIDKESQNIQKRIDRFFGENVKYDRKLPLNKGHILFLKHFKESDINNCCEEFGLRFVKVTFYNNELELTGPKAKLDKTENYIKNLTGDIQSKEEIFDLQSFGNFLKSSEGKGFLIEIGQNTRSIIMTKDQVETTNTEAARREERDPVGVSLVFYAEHQDNIESAVDGVKERYRNQLVNKEITEEAIAELSDSKIRSIRDIGAMNDVLVTVKQPERTIAIHGRNIDVHCTAVSILELLLETQSEQPKMMYQQMAQFSVKSQWYYIRDENPSFKAVPFTADMNFEIEKAFDRKQKCVTINEMQFNIDDCDNMYRSNSVKVKLVRNSCLRKKDLPEHWSAMSSNENLLMVEVEGEEYNSVKASFTKGLQSHQKGRIEIEKIERIQNRKLYSDYQDRLELTKLKNPRDIRNETESLWHVPFYQIGDVKEWESDITKEGFSHSKHKCGSRCFFGDGILFGDSSGTSVNYSSSKSFLCSVITGTCCQGRNGLKRLPKSDNEVQYDSAVERIDDPTRYVIFNGRQILPKYLVTYKMNKKQKFDV